MEFLQKANISVKIANNGKEAIEILENEEFDGVLMDCQMPILDGYEATKEIRKINKNIPIVALSANALKRDMEISKNIGMNDHLNKPIETEKLFAILLKYISKKIDIDLLNATG